MDFFNLRADGVEVVELKPLPPDPSVTKDLAIYLFSNQANERQCIVNIGHCFSELCC